MQPLKNAVPAFSLCKMCQWGRLARGGRPHLGPQARRHKCTRARAGQGRAGRQLHGRPLLGWDSSNEAAHRRDVAVGLQHRGQARALSCNVVGWSAGGCAGGQGSLSARHAMAPATACVIGRPWCSPPILILHPALRFPPVPSQPVGGLLGGRGDGFGWRSAGDQILLLCDAGGDGPK